MHAPHRAVLALAITAAALAGCATTSPQEDVVAVPAATPAEAARTAATAGTDTMLRGVDVGPGGGRAVTLAFTMDQPPGNLTIMPDGRRIFSLHQAFTPERVLAEVTGEGEAARVVHFPARGEGELPMGLATVLGIRADTAGTLYILDNGMNGKAPRKLVIWNPRGSTAPRTIDLSAVTDTNSFVNDIVFDYRRNHVYLSDPAGGPNAQLVAVDLASGRARRLLTGHSSVVPEPIEFATEGIVPTRMKPDRSLEKLKLGVDGIVIDYQREWVYYTPLHGRTMWRVRAADLADATMPAATLAGRVERYAAKPPSDGMVMDEAGNIYLGDLPNNAFGVVGPDRQYRELARRADLSWVDDFEWGADGMLYVVTTQLHRSPELNAGRRAAQLPWRIFRTQPLARGRQGY